MSSKRCHSRYGISANWSAVSNPEVLTALGEVVKSKSDRVVAVAGGAIVDEMLYRALVYRLHPDKGIIANYFAPDRPLGAFGNRITLAYLLGMIDKSPLSKLELVLA